MKKVTLAQLINEDFGYALPDIDRDVAVRCPWHKDSGLSLSVNPVRGTCLLYTSPSPRDRQKSRMPSSA